MVSAARQRDRAVGVASGVESHRHEVSVLERHVRCVAAPIRDTDGRIVASVGISAPTTRFPPKRFAAGRIQVAAAAQAIMKALAG
jgi:DNA-binding IclR family transcriptional regulator